MTAGSPPIPPPPKSRKMPFSLRAPLPARPPILIPAPAPGENVSQAIKDKICEIALGLLEEQVQARIVLYKADLETNPELDAITAQVVEELKEIQAQANTLSPGVPAAREVVREAHEKLLLGLLERFFPRPAPSLFLEKRLKEIHRKLARLYFQSELHDKTCGKDGTVKVIQHGEQAIFYLLTRYENRLKAELNGFDYASEEVKEHAFELLAKVAKDMQDAFLARRSSELKRIVRTFHGILVDFLCKQLAPTIPELSREVIAQAETFEGRAFAYKVSLEAFPRFRSAFERRLMSRLVSFAEDELLTRLADTAGTEREETVQFITDPRIFSMILGELCEALYEYLCNEGFLDLPPDWRQVMGTQPTA